MTRPKHSFLSLSTKSIILDKLNQGRSIRAVAIEFGISSSAVFGIKKNSEKIRKYVANSYNGTGKL